MNGRWPSCAATSPGSASRAARMWPSRRTTSRFLCETLAGLIEGRLGAPDEAGAFFERHMRPWAARFFADLEKAEAARFYRSVGALGRSPSKRIEQAAAELPQ